MQIIISFMSFEVILVLEVCCEVWVRLTQMAPKPSDPRFLRARCALVVSLLGALQDIAGDAFCFVTVRKQSHKQWVGRMLQPYLIFFVLSCAVSLAGMVVKTLLLLEKFQSRHRARQDGSSRARLSLGKMVIKRESLRNVKTEKTVAELQAKFDAHKLSRRKDYCALLAVFFEDLPMGILNTLYLL